MRVSLFCRRWPQEPPAHLEQYLTIAHHEPFRRNSGFGTATMGNEREGKVATDFSADEDAAVRTVHRRFVWFLILLFVSSYLARINISFAARAMNKDLNLTATMFGLASSIFYGAHTAAEITSNMMMPRLAPRLW